MKKLFFAFCLLIGLASCGNGKRNTEVQEAQSLPQDTTVTVDTLCVAESTISTPGDESIVPVAADESFADFLYNFALDENLQLRRILFPLPCHLDNRKDSIHEENWKHDPLFSQEEFYTMLFDTMDDTELEKDTSLTHVRIERIELKTRKMKRYHFERLEGLWTLKAIDETYLPEERKGLKDFYTFYERFASDSLFQAEHTADPLPFVAPDPEDEFQILKTTLKKEQWFTFQPKLPMEYLTNINYGQRLKKNSRTRVIELRGFGNGFNNALFFRFRNGAWKLTRFEDLSN